MVLGVVGCEGNVMAQHFFHQGLWMNTAGYTVVLETLVNLWIDLGRAYAFQQDSAPVHKPVVTQSARPHHTKHAAT